MTGRKLHFADALLPTGWQRDVAVVIDGKGTITDVVRGPDVAGAERIAGIAVAGMANVHSHAHQRAMAGLAETAGPGEDSFWTWRETMYGFALKMSPDDLEAVAAQLYVEALKAGFTSIGEFQYLHHAPDGRPYDAPAEMSLRCLAAAEATGIAITLLPTLYRDGGFGGATAASGQRRFVNDLDRFLRITGDLDRKVRERPLAQLGIAPHSLRAVAPDLLANAIAGLDGLRPGAPVHIHVAEQVKEVEDCLAFSGRRPVELLASIQTLSPRWCIIHATHMTGPETEALAASGAVAGLCPTTEANLGDGTFNARAFLAAGGTIAIGSDSHISVSPAEDLRQLEYSQRLQLRARNVLAGGPGASTGRSLFDAAANGGAQALAQKTGRLAAGFRADIVVLDGEHPALCGRAGDGILDSWIFSGGNPCVKDVFVAGRQVVRDRRHADEPAIAERFRSALGRLKS
jgi:formimidoylglutamate deiminase